MPVFTSLADRCDSCGGEDVRSSEKSDVCTYVWASCFSSQPKCGQTGAFPLLTEQLGVQRDFSERKICKANFLVWLSKPGCPCFFFLFSFLFSTGGSFNDFAKYNRHPEIKLNTRNGGKPHSAMERDDNGYFKLSNVWTISASPHRPLELTC